MWIFDPYISTKLQLYLPLWLYTATKKNTGISTVNVKTIKAKCRFK
jgi:hypothetical protein